MSWRPLPIVLASCTVAVISAFAVKPTPFPAATLTNRLALVAIVIGAGVFLRTSRGWASGSPLTALCSANFFYSLAVSTLMGLHLIAVLLVPFGVVPTVETFVYDFRFYSLVLLGIVMLVPAFRCVAASRGLAAGAFSSWERAWRNTLLLVSVNVPLAPIQDFGIAFSVAGFVNLSLLRLSRSAFARSSGNPTPRD